MSSLKEQKYQLIEDLYEAKINTPAEIAEQIDNFIEAVEEEVVNKRQEEFQRLYHVVMERAIQAARNIQERENESAKSISGNDNNESAVD